MGQTTALIKARQNARELEDDARAREKRELAMVEAAVCLNAQRVFSVIQTGGEEELSRFNSA